MIIFQKIKNLKNNFLFKNFHYLNIFRAWCKERWLLRKTLFSSLDQFTHRMIFFSLKFANFDILQWCIHCLRLLDVMDLERIHRGDRNASLDFQFEKTQRILVIYWLFLLFSPQLPRFFMFIFCKIMFLIYLVSFPFLHILIWIAGFLLIICVF